MARRSIVSSIPWLVIAAAIALRFAAPGLIERLSLLAFDVYQRLEPRPYRAAPVRIAAIDDASLARYGPWPWPRTLLARLVDRLDAAGAAAIGFDIVFAEPDETSPERILKRLAPGAGDAGALDDRLPGLPDHDRVFARSLAAAKTRS